MFSQQELCLKTQHSRYLNENAELKNEVHSVAEDSPLMAAVEAEVEKAP